MLSLQENLKRVSTLLVFQEYNKLWCRYIQIIFIQPTEETLGLESILL